MRPMKIVTLVLGIVAAFVALALVVGGIALIAIHSTQRDADGYYTFDAHPYSAPGYAITSEDIELTADPTDWFPSNIATVRITATGDGVFVGIGPRADVERYLNGVAHSVISAIDSDPFNVTYGQVEGGAPPTPPTEQDFWAASISGSGEPTLTWDLEGGQWVLVVMNADGSQGIDLQLEAGVKTGLLLPVGIGMLVVGLLVAGGSVLLIVFSTRNRRRPAPAPTPARPDLSPPS
jgi:hypothetical protein